MEAPNTASDKTPSSFVMYNPNIPNPHHTEHNNKSHNQNPDPESHLTKKMINFSTNPSQRPAMMNFGSNMHYENNGCKYEANNNNNMPLQQQKPVNYKGYFPIMGQMPNFSENQANKTGKKTHHSYYLPTKKEQNPLLNSAKAFNSKQTTMEKQQIPKNYGMMQNFQMNYPQNQQEYKQMYNNNLKPSVFMGYPPQNSSNVPSSGNNEIENNTNNAIGQKKMMKSGINTMPNLNQNPQNHAQNQTKPMNFYQINVSNPVNQQIPSNNYNNSIELLQNRMHMLHTQQAKGQHNDNNSNLNYEKPNINTNSSPFNLDNEHLLKLYRQFTEKKACAFQLQNPNKKFSKIKEKQKPTKPNQTKEPPLITNSKDVLDQKEKYNEKLIQNSMISNANEQKIGALTVEERRMKIEKYLKKKRKRSFNRKINYACRKQVADKRLRIKGRFMKKPKQDRGDHL